jgi:hypothetical protein
MKNTRGIALFWAIAALAGVAAVYMLVLIIGQMPTISNDGYVSRLLPAQGKWFWFTIIPFITFTFRYFTELVKNDYEKFVRNIWGYIKFGAFIGTMAFTLILLSHQFNTLAFVSLLLLELALMIFGPFFTKDHVEGVIIATFSNMVLVLLYFVFITPYKIEILLLLPGIVMTLLFLNAIAFSVWPFIVSILERIFSKEFLESIRIGLEQAIRQ